MIVFYWIQVQGTKQATPEEGKQSKRVMKPNELGPRHRPSHIIVVNLKKLVKLLGMTMDMKSQEWQQRKMCFRMSTIDCWPMLQCQRCFMQLVEDDTSFCLDSSTQGTNKNNDKEFIKFWIRIRKWCAKTKWSIWIVVSYHLSCSITFFHDKSSSASLTPS